MSAANKAWVRALTYTKNAANETLPGLIDNLADQYGDQIALLSDKETLTYRQLTERVNRYARLILSQGVISGDVVGLLMPNCPDYVVTWLALTRIGCTVALLNTNLRGDALIHCLQAAKVTTLIFDDILPPKQTPAECWNWSVMRSKSDKFSKRAFIPSARVALPRPQDRALLIYTSGTTGLPKATIITHRRIIEWSFWFAGMMDVQPSDRSYNCLPMYHSTGGVIAIGALLVKGGSVFIRERFSASKFWDEVIDNHCTIFNYIGELCRYLTNSPPHPREREHTLRLACGNGLQKDVWLKMQERFLVPQILEFYAATEGNLSLYNCEGKPGAIGRVPPFLANQYEIALIQCDQETEEPIRDAFGYCIRCGIDEPGLAINPINDRFDGYTDFAASQRKILKNVFVDGDRWFRSGDLMRKDSGGYYYFVDRLGDTFRWKGENVSTTEVANVLRACKGVVDAMVYGVEVPDQEGRAGMAAIVIDATFTWEGLSEHLKQLPVYARPMFVRVCETLDITGTFKQSKTVFVKENYQIENVWQRQIDGAYTPK